MKAALQTTREKDRGILMNGNLGVTLQCTPESQKSQKASCILGSVIASFILGCTKRKGQEVQGGDSSLLLHPHTTASRPGSLITRKMQTCWNRPEFNPTSLHTSGPMKLITLFHTARENSQSCNPGKLNLMPPLREIILR